MHRQPFPIQGRIPKIRPWVEDDSKTNEDDECDFAQEDAQKASEDMEEDGTLVYLQIKQDLVGTERKIMSRGAVVVAYTEAALDAQLVEALPERGIGRAGPKGPYQVYITEPDIDLLLSHISHLVIGEGDNRVKCTLSKRVFEVRNDDADSDGVSAEEDPIHIVHYLSEGSMFSKVKTGHLVGFWKAEGFKVSRANRENAKVDGVEGGVAGLFTEAIHLNIRGMEVQPGVGEDDGYDGMDRGGTGPQG